MPKSQTKSKADEAPSLKEYSRQIAKYMGVEWSEAFYQRIYRIRKGDSEPSTEELSAMDAWDKVEENPHDYAAIGYRMLGKKSTIDMLRRYMRSGIFNTTQTERMFSSIFNALNL